MTLNEKPIKETFIRSVVISSVVVPDIGHFYCQIIVDFAAFYSAPIVGFGHANIGLVSNKF